MNNFFIDKLVLSSSPSGKNCLAVAIVFHENSGKLACCRLGDERWKIAELYRDMELERVRIVAIEDVIHLDGKFYALDYRGRVIVLFDEEVEASTPKAILFASQPEGFCCWEGKLYLVESSDFNYCLKSQKKAFQRIAGSDTGVFSLEDGTLPLEFPGYEGRCPVHNDCRTRILPPPVWVTPNSF
ncbi:hypothetical protein IFM89_011048 [Coptis chinensis]|uniref:KIB1-4 beta-propeller domain-containing protein n=1 Tax=Coptis chinensis TaxID=261450 RepID=A0A835IPA4_9MAGN|nr:hypothetical protein IFM89_011048 [Coptis chinensis]